MTARVVLLTGGNLGDVPETLAAARRKLAERVGAEVAASALYESEPWGFEASERFFNQVLVLSTKLNPEQVLDMCQQIEREAGRVRDTACHASCEGVHNENPTDRMPQRYSSRTLDIDILFYDDALIDIPRLTVPHPLIQQRGFVLMPLAEVLPDFIHPLLHKSIRQLLAELTGRSLPRGKKPDPLLKGGKAP